MIKGKTLIELTDVKTGKVERFEDENILTNGGQLYANLTVMVSANKYKLGEYPAEARPFPLSNMVFGGIKLFESSIEESVNNFLMPNIGLNSIIGYASDEVTSGKDTRRGSRNLEETTVLENGMQIVWDFATSEANGTISCVCLTSGLGGEAAIPNPRGFWKCSNFEGLPVSYDAETMVMTTISISGTVTVRKYKLETTVLSLDTQPLVCKLIDTQIGSDTSTYQWRDSGGDYWYYINSVSSTSITYSKMDKTTLAITEATISHSLSLESKYDVNFAIWNGYLYAPASTHDKIYKIDLGNTSNIIEFALQTWGVLKTNMIHIFPYRDNMLLVNGLLVDINTGAYEVIDPDFNVSGGSFYRIATGITSNSSYNYSQLSILYGLGFMFSHYKASSTAFMGLDIDHSMLMSINNLETPVTKTADKTMKITYTLTYTQ